MSANRATHPLHTVKSQSQLITTHLTGAGGADMANADAALFGGGEIVSAVRTGAGTFTLTFRRTFPSGRPCGHDVVGTTAGLRARYTAFDPVAGTATLKLEVGAVATDPAATDDVYLSFLMRNSGANK